MRAPLRVSSSGSPGPAPIRKTFPAVAGGSLEFDTPFWPFAKLSARPAALRQWHALIDDDAPAGPSRRFNFLLPDGGEPPDHLSARIAHRPARNRRTRRSSGRHTVRFPAKRRRSRLEQALPPIDDGL